MNIIIKSTNITLLPEMTSLIKEKFSSVEKFYPNIIEARVEIEFDEYKKKGHNYRCEVNMSIPGKLLRVEKTTPNFIKSVNKVKDHLKVVLTKEKEKELKKRSM
jgi:ribosomal subunit interface protein